MEQTNKVVLFLSYDGMSDSLGESQVLPYLFGLSEQGHKIHILSNEKEEPLKQKQERLKNLLKEHGIEWRYVLYKNTPPVLGSYLNFKRFRREAEAWHQEKHFQVIHARSLMPAMVGNKLRNKLPAKLLFDMRGFWADERVEGGIWDLKNPLYKYLYDYFKKQEYQIFHSADYIISLTENGKDYIQKEIKPKARIQVIPCAADLDHFNYQRLNQSKQNKLREELELKESDFVLSYIGSLGTRYLLDNMIAFFKQLFILQPSAKFLFISKHPESEIKIAWQKANLPESALRICSSTYQEIPQYIALSNSSIFFIVSSFTGKAVSPTKQAEVMGLGLPIITNRGIGDSDTIIEKHDCGLVLSDYTELAYKEAAQRLLENSWEKEKIRETAEAYFSLSNAIEKYAQVYLNL